MPPYELYLDDIRECIRKIESFSDGLNFSRFSKDEKTVDAVIRNLEIIGEAVKKIPIDIKKKNPDVEWKKIAGLRDILIHEYAGINMKIIWDVVRNKVPELKKSIQNIKV
jgi:uncharacterized protein with HEPN domain